MRCCVLLPTYNNAGSIGSVIDGILGFTGDLIVINDGSTDETAAILTGYPAVKTIGYPKNRGKGYALRQGFKAALDAGYTHAISIDADGQHYPGDLPVFFEAMQTRPGALVIGARNLGGTENVPGKSSFGNRFSNFWFKLYTGIEAPDTQSGYRLYPLLPLAKMRWYTVKYEFEVEVIVRAAWAGIPVMSVPVKVYYPPAEERVSHFRPFSDFSRISVLNTVFFFACIFYIWPRNFFRKLLRKSGRQELMQMLFEPGQSAERKAVSIGFGVFMGIIPIWGFQLLTAIFLAVLLKLNKALVIAAANISIPPVIPFILYGSFLAGKPFMGEQARDIHWTDQLNLSTIQQNLQQYLVGACVLALAAGMVIGLLSYIAMKWERIFSA